MSTSPEFLWYIPNDVKAGHRGDTATDDHNGLDTLTAQAKAIERHGWKGALIGTGWGRPDTFTVATALAARTTTFEPLIAIRPGYWKPANFASAAATLDQLSEGRVRVNIVSGHDELAAYGDTEGNQSQRYARTKEFMRLVRRLWTEENVSFAGEHFRVTGSTVVPRFEGRNGRLHPKLYFGGASEAAEQVAASEADVQLFWGEPLDGVRERIDRLQPNPRPRSPLAAIWPEDHDTCSRYNGTGMGGRRGQGSENGGGQGWQLAGSSPDSCHRPATPFGSGGSR